MWRRRYEEDWERRKQYLIRSLFEDPPPLSPVPEEDESFDSIRRTTIAPRPYISKSISRPYSPLPPLTIEREPNRHDEPEEYYRKLEKKVLRVYRKLFIEGKSDISDDTSDEEVINEEVDVTKEMEDAAKGVEGQSYDDNDIYNTVAFFEMADKRDDNYCTSQNNFERDPRNYKLSFLSNIEEADDYLNDPNEVFIEKNKKNNSEKAGHNDFHKSNEINEDDENLQNSDESIDMQIHGRKRTISNQNTNDTSKSKKSKSSHDTSSTEVIPERLQYTINHSGEELVIEPNDFRDQDTNDTSKSKKSKSSDDSSSTEVIPKNLQYTNNHSTESGIEPNDFRDHRVVHVEADIHRNAVEEMPHARLSVVVDALENDDVTLILEENRVPDVLSSSGCKRSWSSISEESISCEDVGTQTQCDYESANQDILRDIFVGPPKVFRLCSCANHVCVC